MKTLKHARVQLENNFQNYLAANILLKKYHVVIARQGSRESAKFVLKGQKTKWKTNEKRHNLPM